MRQQLGGLNMVEQFKSIFLPIEKVKPAETSYSAETFSIQDFYEKHYEIQELDLQDVKYILHQGKAHQEYRKYKETSKRSEPWIKLGVAISVTKCLSDMDMTFKRFIASTGYQNLVKKFGVVTAMGQNYNFEACLPLNRNLATFIFPGIEWIPQAIRDKTLHYDVKLIGSLFALAILIDFQTYLNTNKKESKLEFKKWMEAPTNTNCVISMIRNYGKVFTLSKEQDEYFTDVLVNCRVNQTGYALKRIADQFMVSSNQKYLSAMAKAAAERMEDNPEE